MKYVSDKTNLKGKLVREEILQCMIASFKIEGIDIRADLANAALKKIQLNLEKQI